METKEHEPETEKKIMEERPPKAKKQKKELVPSCAVISAAARVKVYT